MPTYVYRFLDTGETIEVRQGFDDAPLTEAPHPSDGKPRPVKKVFTPVGVTFKGSGFYKTDSGGGSRTTTADTVTKSGDAGAGTGSGTDSGTATGSGTASGAGTGSGTATSAAD